MNPFLGILLQILAVLAFTVQGAFVRHLGGRFPLGEMVFARSTIALIPVVVMLAWQGQLRSALHTKHLTKHVTRSFTNVGGMFFNYAGLTRIPLADATAIGYAMPLFTVVLAWMFLGEIVRLWRWTAVVVGLIGVLVMLSPYLGQGTAESYSAWGAIFCLVAAFLFGVAMTLVRHMAKTETTGSLVFYYSIIAAVVGALTVFWGWVMPTPTEFLLLLALGIAGGLAQILMTESFRYGSAAVLAPFAYTSMLWAVAIGYVWFAEIPGPIVLLGAAIVIGAGLFVIWREHQLGLDRKRAQAETGPPPV